MIYSITTVVLYNLVNALIHSIMIKKQKKIRHTMWAFFYCMFITGAYLWAKEWNIILFSVLVRKPVFDVSLNLFRGKSAWYVSKSTTSKIDLAILRHTRLPAPVYQIILLLFSIITIFL